MPNIVINLHYQWLLIINYVSNARTNECEYDLPHKIKIEENHIIWGLNPPIKEEN